MPCGALACAEALSLLFKHWTCNNLSTPRMADETPPTTAGRRPYEDGLQLGPRKKAYVPSLIHLCPYRATNPFVRSCISDPLVSAGRHFGRTVHALCNIRTILTNGLLRLGELADESDEAFTLEY